MAVYCIYLLTLDQVWLPRRELTLPVQGRGRSNRPWTDRLINWSKLLKQLRAQLLGMLPYVLVALTAQFSRAFAAITLLFVLIVARILCTFQGAQPGED